ncbi:MAG TPA: hypothetical protein VMF64_03815 [Steroidobacteraceae bacterium]|nr:hypothetical protein [Steroidobacteraceae bacterium]
MVLVLGMLGVPLLVSAADAPAPGEPVAKQDEAGPIQVLQMRPDLYMLTIEGVNSAVQVGPEGIVVVDTGPARDAHAVLAQIGKLSSAPIRYVIDTSADPEFTGGNALLSDAGESLEVGWAPLLQAANHIQDIRALASRRAPIVARLGVIEQMVQQAQGSQSSQSSTFGDSLPTDTFTRPEFNFRVNDQAVQVVSMPPAHSSSDTVVLFRRSDVVATGAIFDDTRFPVIDVAQGGSINGEIDAVNQVLNTLVVGAMPVVTNAGGTWIIPERGPVCDQVDLLTYRDMLFAIRNRVQSLVDQGRSLAQVQAADPAQGYRTRYGAQSGPWTTRDFVDAVYRSLEARKHSHAQPKG